MDFISQKKVFIHPSMDFIVFSIDFNTDVRENAVPGAEML